MVGQIGSGSRLVLGTAQFGMAYGLTNLRGKVTVRELGRILDLAETSGILELDTAAAYGDAEAALGAELQGRSAFRLTTKTVPLATVPVGAAGKAIREGIHRSLERLRRSSVDVLMLHHADALRRDDADEAIEALRGAVSEGLARRIGLSVYDGDEIALGRRDLEPDVIQAPINLLDRRLIESGDLAALAASGIDVHARSVFLQGLLLADPDRIPDRAPPTSRAVLIGLRRMLDEAGWSPLAASLKFVQEQPGVSRVIVGVTSADELADIVAAATDERRLGSLGSLPSDMGSDLIDPRRWPA